MKQKQTIIFLSRLYHPHIGGVEKHVSELIPLLQVLGYKVIVITERFDDSLKSKEIINGYTIYRIPICRSVIFKKIYIWSWILKNIIIFLKADIIHVHDIFYWLLPFRLILFNKKIYTTFHGYEGYPISTRWIIQRKVIEILSNGTICVGDFMTKWYKTKPNAVIYGGVRVKLNNKTHKRPIAVFFGRLDDQTGILDYLKAYKIIKAEYPEFELTVIGEGKYEAKIPKGVTLLNMQPNVTKYIEKSRFVFVSRYLSILEAMIQKKEVYAVYTDPIMKDYLLMSPFKKYIFISSNAKNIAENVIKSLNVGADAEKIRKGREFALKNSWNHVLHVYLNLWK